MSSLTLPHPPAKIAVPDSILEVAGGRKGSSPFIDCRYLCIPASRGEDLRLQQLNWQVTKLDRHLTPVSGKDRTGFLQASAADLASSPLLLLHSSLAGN